MSKLTPEQEEFLLAKRFAREFYASRSFRYQEDEENYLENSFLAYLKEWKKLCQTHQI